jgi:hypothetical protein
MEGLRFGLAFDSCPTFFVLCHIPSNESCRYRYPERMRMETGDATRFPAEPFITTTTERRGLRARRIGRLVCLPR